MSAPLSPMSLPAQKQLKYTPGIANGSVTESATWMNQSRKVRFFLSYFFCPPISIESSGLTFCLLISLNFLFVQMVPLAQLSTKRVVTIGQAGKLWRWKRSHHQWLVQFKWKWQKPWRLSEWIRHSDETIIRSKPRQLALLHRV